jgi:hypothetical protein
MASLFEAMHCELQIDLECKAVKCFNNFIWMGAIRLLILLWQTLQKYLTKFLFIYEFSTTLFLHSSPKNTFVLLHLGTLLMYVIFLHNFGFTEATDSRWVRVVCWYADINVHASANSDLVVHFIVSLSLVWSALRAIYLLCICLNFLICITI